MNLIPICISGQMPQGLEDIQWYGRAYGSYSRLATAPSHSENASNCGEGDASDHSNSGSVGS